jgi:outer membrane protein
MRKIALFSLIVAAALAWGSPAQAQGMKIGVFDPARISQETREGLRVQDKLEAIRDEKQAEISSKEEKIKELQSQLQQQSLSLSADRRASMQLDIQKKLLDLENASNMASRELQLELNGAQQRFNELLVQGVESFGRKEGFDMLLDATLIAWNNESLDVTTALIDHFDQMFPGTEE